MGSDKDTNDQSDAPQRSAQDQDVVMSEAASAGASGEDNNNNSSSASGAPQMSLSNDEVNYLIFRYVSLKFIIRDERVILFIQTGLGHPRTWVLEDP